MGEMTIERREEITGEMLERLISSAVDRGLDRQEAVRVCRRRIEAMGDTLERGWRARLHEAIDERIAEGERT